MRLLVFAMLIPLGIGCTITKTDVVKTGLFENDLEKISKAYEEIEKKPKGSVATKDLESAGWNFKSANVRRLSGRTAFRRIFGEGVFQGALAEVTKTGEEDKSKVDALLRDMNQYHAIFIPYKDVNTYVDRFYFSTKETAQNGDDLLILFMFKNDMLVYCDYEYVKIDSKQSEGAFAQGLLELFEKFAGVADTVKDLAEKIRDMNKKE
ncbi:MAG: hypothetical protein G01um10143_74 [Parcubacteria group bacterium Gr01-1014_3]|nr:MAG: hypothetical protein G01um10143_74 [Parcubacteria group bacterium Gr01-1014_3]